jgi:transposase IS116/IS110/IS902 family protein
MNYDALEPVQRLKRDLAMAAKDLSLDEVGYIVNGYYALQEYRKVSANQYRALEKSKQPNDLIGWLVRQGEIIESQIHRALDQWTETSEICLWAKSITGIGPIISAGLAAHIDITKCPTVGHIWRFAGLDPTVT